MEDCHREIILNNVDSLIKYTDYERLVKKCLDSGIISNIMKDVIESTPGPTVNKHKALFIKLTKRGPDAYNLLEQILKDLNYTNAAKILRCGAQSGVWKSINEEKYKSKQEISNDIRNQNNTLSNGSTEEVDDSSRTILHNNNPSDLQMYAIPTNPDIKFVVKKSIKLPNVGKVPTYPMKSRYRGVFFMVNIVEFPQKPEEWEKRRNGATVDRDNLIHLFREFGFEIFYYQDLTLEKFNELLQELLNSQYVNRTECFIMALMTHGSMDCGRERIEFHNGEIEDINNILDKFKNNICPYLVGKPKIFFFPFCRGDISDRGTFTKGIPRRVETDSIYPHPNLPTYSDMLICYATVPGFKTHRDPDKGSWYIQILCEIWAEHAHDTNIEDLLKIVGEKTGQIRTIDSRLQTSSRTDYGFNKQLFFNPGYYGD